MLLDEGVESRAREAAGLDRLDIADYLGLTKETVSRLFTSLKTTGVIRLLSDDRVSITNPAQLKYLASEC